MQRIENGSWISTRSNFLESLAVMKILWKQSLDKMVVIQMENRQREWNWLKKVKAEFWVHETN